MPTTDELIADLSADAPKVAPGAVRRRIALGLGLGGLGSALVMLVWLGPRPDLAQAVTTPMFWVKFAYAAATGLLAVGLMARLSRPGGRAGAVAALALAPFGLVVAMAVVRLARAAPSEHPALLMGHSSMVCPWRIAAIGLPLLAGAVWAVRGLAPTRLTLAGLAAGGAAGALGAMIYSVACSETSSPFLAVWYTAGMALMAAFGAVSGGRLLRWR